MINCNQPYYVSPSATMSVVNSELSRRQQQPNIDSVSVNYSDGSVINYFKDSTGQVNKIIGAGNNQCASSGFILANPYEVNSTIGQMLNTYV